MIYKQNRMNKNGQKIGLKRGVISYFKPLTRIKIIKSTRTNPTLVYFTNKISKSLEDQKVGLKVREYRVVTVWIKTLSVYY